MNYNKGQLGQMAKQYGFVRDTFEKVLRLKEILTYLNADEYLHEHLALKGGTAINMTIFNLPRLSVDLDLDLHPICHWKIWKKPEGKSQRCWKDI